MSARKVKQELIPLDTSSFFPSGNHALAIRKRLHTNHSPAPPKKIARVSAGGTSNPTDSKARVSRILRTVKVDSVTVQHPEHFKQYLQNLIEIEGPKEGYLGEREDRSFEALFRGYCGKPSEWAAALGPLQSPPAHTKIWEESCNSSLENDNTEDIADRLLYTHRFLESQVKVDHANTFVGYVLRTVQVLKFTMLWTSLDKAPGGTAWKAKYSEAAFKYSNSGLYRQLALATKGSRKYRQLNDDIKSGLATFRGTHSRLITLKKQILSLYYKFGPTVFLDFAWDTFDFKQGKRLNHSGEFHPVAALLCKKCPVFELGLNPVKTEEMDSNKDLLLSTPSDTVHSRTVRRPQQGESIEEDDNDGIPLPVLIFRDTLESLYYILLNLSSRIVADYVYIFIAEHPPPVD